MDYFKQLTQWAERGYYMALEYTPNQGWICALSDTGRYGEAVMTTMDRHHIRAISSRCETPQAAIAELLEVVRP